MNDDADTKTLADLAEVSLGYPFRGSIPALSTGSVSVVQVGDLGRSGLKDRDRLLRTEVQGRKEPDWLLDQDVLFVSRGPNTYATVLSAPPPRTVCSPHIYVIRVKQPDRLLPAFLAWQLNQPPAQRYLRQSAEGSHQLSIRRALLDRIEIRIPPLAQQRAAIELARLASAERDALLALARNRELQLALLAERLLK